MIRLDLRRSPLWRCLAPLAPILAVACGPLVLDPQLPATSFESRWDRVPDRVWVGETYWANRLQDWRIEEGALECVEARPRFGMRTLHLLTHRLVDRPGGSFRTRVRIDAAPGARSGSAAGFLVGAGGEHVDYRLTSQVHGTAAADGGWLALVDGDGRARVASFETSVDGGGSLWAMSSDRELADFIVPEGVRLAGEGFGVDGPRAVDLELTGARFDGRRTLGLVVRDAASAEVLSSAVLEDAPASAFDGALALCSHRGPKGPEGELASGYRFSDWDLTGELVEGDPERAFGPVLFVHYTVDVVGDGVARLGMTAQTGPLGDDDARTATLELENERGRFEVAEVAPWIAGSATFHFDVPGIDPDRDIPFRVRYVPHDRRGDPVPADEQVYGGVIAAQPPPGALKIAVLSCQKSYTGGLRWNEGGLWFPHAEVRDHVAAHEPDLLYFAGDQIYEGDLTPAVRRPDDRALNDYLHKWYRHGWSFGELTRRLPAVVVPDDHDVYHGNLWGNAGVRMDGPEGATLQDRGGYVMPTHFVNAVHRTQVAHLPLPFDPEPLVNGVSRYPTTLTWGGGSFAILADRMDKSPPTILVPEGRVKNGWFQAEGFDPAESADVPGARLLGDSQLDLLRAWGSDWSRGVWFKACLSQSPFANVATLPRGARSDGVVPSLEVPAPGEYVAGDARVADADSNGWPQSGRSAAVALLRAAGAFHLAGDQHLGSTVRYGVEAFDDAGFVLSTPAVANTWPRRWFPDPAERQPGPPVALGAPDYTGRYFDGFGNRMTVHAVANPRADGVAPERLHSRVPGYGIVRLVRDEQQPGGGVVDFEAWPRHVHPGEPGAAPYGGWPVTFPLAAGDGREPVAHLAELLLPADGVVIVQVEREGGGGGVLYTRRVVAERFRPPVFGAGSRYTLRVRRPDATDGWAFERSGLSPGGEAISLDGVLDPWPR